MDEDMESDEALHAKQDDAWRAFIVLCAQFGVDFTEKIENLAKVYQDIQFACYFHDMLYLSNVLHGEKEGKWAEAQAMAQLQPDSTKWTVAMYRSIGFEIECGNVGGEDFQSARCLFLRGVVLGNNPDRPNLYETTEDTAEELTPRAMQVLPQTVNIKRQTLEKARAAVRILVERFGKTPVESKAEGKTDKLCPDRIDMRTELDTELTNACEDLKSLKAFHDFMHEEDQIFDPQSPFEYAPNTLVPTLHAASIEPNSKFWRFELMQMVLDGSDPNPTIQAWEETKFYNMRSPGYEGCVIGYDESDARCERLRLCEQLYRIDNGEGDGTMESDNGAGSSDAGSIPRARTPVTPGTPPARLLTDEEIEGMWGFLTGPF